MADITTFLILNGALMGSVFVVLLWLLGHHGIRKGVEHDLALIRRRVRALEARAERRRDLAA